MRVYEVNPIQKHPTKFNKLKERYQEEFDKFKIIEDGTVHDILVNESCSYRVIPSLQVSLH